MCQVKSNFRTAGKRRTFINHRKMQGLFVFAGKLCLLFLLIGGLGSQGMAQCEPGGFCQVGYHWVDFDTYLAIYGGNVGIGTPEPSQKLSLAGDLGFPANAVLTSPGYPVFANVAGFGLQLSTFMFGVAINGHTSPDFVINNAGNVGVGTTNPQASLDVNGNINYGQLTKLDVVANNAATVRVADFLIGHPQRLGNPGRAMVDNGQNGLFINFGRDWPRTWVGSDLVVDGITTTKTLQITGGGDLSEKFDVSNSQSKIEPGMVVAIDPANPGRLIVSTQAYDRRVAGILSGAGGVQPGMLMGQAGTLADGGHPVALTGRVYVWADASNGPIAPGDLLTTSHVPGHAMKITDYTKAQGATIGKAMTGLAQGRGLVLALVTLQ